MRKVSIFLIILFCLTIPNTASGSVLPSAVSREGSFLTFCLSPDQVQCVESLEYLSKDQAGGQFEPLTYQAPSSGNTAAVTFTTSGTSFQTTDGPKSILLNAQVEISKVSGETWMVPGYLGSPDSSGNTLNPNLIPIKEKVSARSFISISNDQGGVSVQGNGSLRLGDKFRLVFRSGNLNPTSFETRTRKFDFSVIQRNGYNVISEEGEVGEYLINEAGAFSQTCYSSTSKAWAAAGYWFTEAYSATPAAGYVLVPYKATMQTDCPIVLPSYAGNGQTQFSLSAPHFRPDGVTPINGYMEIQMPLAYWPNLSREESNQVSVSYGGAFSPVTATRTLTDREVKYVIEDFHFSAPTFAIGAEYFTTGTKGKSIKTSKILSTVKFTKSNRSKLSYKSLTTKNCKLSGSKLKLTNRGTCTLQVKVQQPKPSPILVSGPITLTRNKMSSIQVANALGASLPVGSSLSMSVAKSSKSDCKVVSGKLVKKGSGKCAVKLKIQAPAPVASTERIRISVT